jgi:hypothetical protein
MITEVEDGERRSDGIPAHAPGLTEPHRSGRTGRFFRCSNCGRSPLIIRHCNRQRLCAVCEQCGHHSAIKREDLEAGTGHRHPSAPAHAERQPPNST